MSARAQTLSTAWRALVGHGLADLSPPEAAHSLLELPTNRPEYVGVLQDMGDWPARSPIGQRLPTDADVEQLQKLGGRWRAVTMLEDDRALRVAGAAFSRTFVLDPLYDSGDLLYAAWHDPIVSAEHAHRLAAQAGLLVRAGPLLKSGAAVLTPDHLPGSWDPRPGWRPRLPHANPNVNAAWYLRTAFVLLYWADRLDAVVCTSSEEIADGLRLAGVATAERQVRVAELPGVEAAHAARAVCAAELSAAWRAARRACRRRRAEKLDQAVCALERVAEIVEVPASAWRLCLGQQEVPEPALLIRRVLNGEDARRAPPLPGKALWRAPLVLVPGSA